MDILATTGVWEDHILGGFPKEAPPYESLWLPFDSLTWILVLLSVSVVSLVLLSIEKIWATMKRGDNFVLNKQDYQRQLQIRKKSNLGN